MAAIEKPWEEAKKSAFRFFEEGDYAKSLEVCTGIPAADRDLGVEILIATNLYSTGKTSDAEVCFRDILQKMPDSSHVHSYLGKILEQRGDDGAVTEYATAVLLDPSNPEALRSYAEYLLSCRDYRGALAPLLRLVREAGKPGDIRNLMQAFTETGDAEEALELHRAHGGARDRIPGYIDALTRTGRYPAAAESAYSLYQETGELTFLRIYLNLLSRFDRPASRAAYIRYGDETGDAGIRYDHILLLKSSGEYLPALAEAEKLIAISPDPLHRLVRAELLAALGRHDEALVAYELLVREETGRRDDLGLLEVITGKYRGYLMERMSGSDAAARFLSIVSGDPNVVSLLETGRLYEDLGDMSEARAWFYRAYRTDYLTGGIAYARFLTGQGDDRECEKVMLYILSNIRKNGDLVYVAGVVLDELGGMFRLRRLMERLVQLLEERRATLDSHGLELLAMAFFITATNALEENDYMGCKYSCLCGMDVIPRVTTVIQPGDFTRLLMSCKERAVTDRPVMGSPRAPRKPAENVPLPEDQLGLDEQEQKILAFLRSHRRATEMELRTLLSSRRIAGIMNRLMEKAARKGVRLIGKKGVGENGEVYEYTGA